MLPESLSIKYQQTSTNITSIVSFNQQSGYILRDFCEVASQCNAESVMKNWQAKSQSLTTPGSEQKHVVKLKCPPKKTSQSEISKKIYQKKQLMLDVIHWIFTYADITKNPVFQKSQATLPTLHPKSAVVRFAPRLSRANHIFPLTQRRQQATRLAGFLLARP